MSYYTFYDNACRPYYVQEPPLEPPDCWMEQPDYEEDEDDIMDELELFFDADTHTYTLDGEMLPSVTQLTDIYSTFSARDGDPMELTVEAAAERGTVLHAYLEHRVWGGVRKEFELPDAYGGYADSVDLFLEEHSIDPYLTETPMWGELDDVKFAGTPDFVGMFDGVLSVLDWKFVSQVQKTKVGAQLNGYMSLCLNNDWNPEKLFCVQFRLDGTYRLYPSGRFADSFSLCLSVWRERHKKHPRGEIA